MGSKILKDILKTIPLETSIKTTVQAFFLREAGLGLLIPLDKDGNENPEFMKASDKVLEKCQPLINNLLEDVEKWTERGRPEKKGSTLDSRATLLNKIYKLENRVQELEERD